jgi:hypothetical protein
MATIYYQYLCSGKCVVLKMLKPSSLSTIGMIRGSKTVVLLYLSRRLCLKI